MAAFAFASAISIALASGAIGRTQGGPRGGSQGGVVSLNLCTDELVLLVARPRQIRSVSYLSHAPEDSVLWRRARLYRANDGSMLAAAAMRPRVVVTMGTAGRDRERLAAAVGARLVVLPFADSLDALAANVRAVGRATGNAERAEALVRVIHAARTSAPARRRDAIMIDGAGRANAGSGLGADWLRLAGLDPRKIASNRPGLEMLLARPPAVLVQSRYRHRQTSSATAWARNPAAARVAAGRTLTTDGRRWLCMGPTLLPEILRLREAAR